MVDARIYTKRELQEIQNGARAYDRMAEVQLAKDKEYAARPLQKRDIIKEIYQAIEADNIDTLTFLGEEIGVLNRVRETWRDDAEIQEYAKYLELMDQQIMNELMEEIVNGYCKD